MYDGKYTVTCDSQNLENYILADQLALTVPQMAKLLSISKPTAYALARRPDFPSFKVGNKILVNRAMLQKWLDTQSEKGGIIF